MPRYEAVPKQYWDEEDYEYGEHLTMEVLVSGAEFTGLYDKEGNPIYRQPEPIGFKLRRS